MPGFPQYNISIPLHPARNIHSDLTPSEIQMCFYIYVAQAQKLRLPMGHTGNRALYRSMLETKCLKKNHDSSINTNIVELIATSDVLC